MTLAEAIASTGVDGEAKDQSKIPPPSGYLGSKKLVGMAASSLSTLKVALFNFRDYCGGDKQCKCNSRVGDAVAHGWWNWQKDMA